MAGILGWGDGSDLRSIPRTLVKESQAWCWKFGIPLERWGVRKIPGACWSGSLAYLGGILDEQESLSKAKMENQ